MSNKHLDELTENIFEASTVMHLKVGEENSRRSNFKSIDDNKKYAFRKFISLRPGAEKY